MAYVISEDDYLAHYGILRKSGRYPWGSGGDIRDSSRSFLDWVNEMKKQGLSEAEIAKGVGLGGIRTVELRALKSIALNQVKQEDINRATRLRDEKGYGPSEIGRIMGKPESTIRTLLAPGAKEKADNIKAIADRLQKEVEEKKMLDVGSGVENHLGISRTKLDTAIAYLRETLDYTLHRIKGDPTTAGFQTDKKILTQGDLDWKHVIKNQNDIKSIVGYSEDGGRTFLDMYEPLGLSSKRIAIAYGDMGGAERDGIIYVRPGVPDVSLGGSTYAQVRIAVDGTHYLKGVAVLKDDLPDGVDVMFNTPKMSTGNKLDAMKKMQLDLDGNIDKDNPFGSAIDRQITETNSRGETKTTSVMNIVNDQGDWDKWSKTLSSQFLSKQSPVLARRQLNEDYETRKKDLEEILSLTNPVVRQKLLETYAETTDTASVHLKAAAIPRQKTQLLIPINSLKDTEVYAPNFKQGERVVLVRYPHGGIFEIPELTVTHRNKEGRETIGTGVDVDAIGINSKVASRLSGADFDGDTVLVIPNHGNIKTSAPLEGLKNFDPQKAYPYYEGMKVMNAKHKQKEMGVASNLITDMTIRRASDSEIARAVRYSMVVIDAEKHKLDYRQAYKNNGIASLKEKYQAPYQDSGKAGASTLISRAKSEENVLARKERPASEGGPVDKKTGEKVFVNTGESYVDPKTGKTVMRRTRSTKLAEAKDAHALSTGTVIEKVYADHSNKLKDLANLARKEAVNTQNPHQSPSAKETYKDVIQSLKAKLDLVERNRPRERQAQVIAATVLKAKVAANPSLDKNEKKKIHRQAIKQARRRMGAEAPNVTFTQREWEGIQAGAVSASKLRSLLNKADLDSVRKQAMPRVATVMTTTNQRRAKALLASGRTQAEVAEILGVPLGTLKSSLSDS